MSRPKKFVTQRALRERLAIGWIVAHAFIVANLLVMTYAVGGMSPRELTTVAGMVVPLMAANTSLIVRYFTMHQVHERDRSPRVNGVFVFISVAFPALLFLYVNAVIVLFAYQRIANVELFKGMIAIGEISFGVHAGSIVASLFHTDEPARGAAAAPPGEADANEAAKAG